MSKDTTMPSDEELRQEIKRSGLYLEWAGHTDVPQSEHDRWIDVIISIVNRHSAKALHEAEVRARKEGALQELMSLNIDTESSPGQEIDREITRLRNILVASEKDK